MLRGCRSRAISERSTPSSAPKYPLSPIIPVHPGNPPVSPIIPVHTQKQGGGGIPSNAATDNSLVRITHCLLATKIQNVGAPTFCFLHVAIPGAQTGMSVPQGRSANIRSAKKRGRREIRRPFSFRRLLSYCWAIEIFAVLFCSVPEDGLASICHSELGGQTRYPTSLQA